MRSNDRKHSIAALVFGIVALSSSSCRTAASREEAPQVEAPAVVRTPEPRIFTDDNVVVENVTFSFDRDLIDKVEVFEMPAEKLEAEDIKPDNIRGRTLEFALHYHSSKDQASISVFKLAEYKEAFARFPQYLEHRDQELASLIGKPSTIKRWGIIEQPVHMRWMDAHHDFYAKAQIVSFKGGRGLLMLTQIGQDAYNIINNEQLKFFFQGITDDGVYFVEMSFPANMDGLPKDNSSESYKRYNLPEDFSDTKHQVLYRKYATQVAKEIDSAQDNRFVPSPKRVQAFIGSVRIN